MKLNISAHDDTQLNAVANILAIIEACGELGHSTDFAITVNGDGNGRIKVEFEDKETQESYENLVKESKKLYIDEKVKVEVINAEVLKVVIGG